MYNIIIFISEKVNGGGVNKFAFKSNSRNTIKHLKQFIHDGDPKTAICYATSRKGKIKSKAQYTPSIGFFQCGVIKGCELV